MAHFSPSRGMYWHPYQSVNANPKNPHLLSNLRHAIGAPQRGMWVHNPYHVIPEAIEGATMATAIGAGNYLTRAFRQKPLVGLTKAEHKRIPKGKDSVVVNIPTVSTRRVKKINNNILGTSKAMPYKRSKTTYRKKGQKGRPRRRRARKLPPLALPRSRLVRFRYVTSGQLSGATGTIATAMVKANDLNDPTGALSTALPLGLDQWAAQYQKYIVLGSKIIVRFNNTANTGMVAVGIHLDDDTTALTSVNHYKELPMTKQAVLTTQKDFALVKMNYSGKRFWKLTNIKDDSEQEAAFSTTPGSPTDIAYFHIYCQDFYGGHTATVDYQIEHEFICLLSEPVTLAQSSL